MLRSSQLYLTIDFATDFSWLLAESIGGAGPGVAELILVVVVFPELTLYVRQILGFI